ncbi:MAG: C10 family peptidase [Bacteroidota bacterium]|nr:C10 family peptidase [Bacteroidota bacterium]
MKKLTSLLVLFLITFSFSFAGIVTPDKARQVAMNFFSNKTINGKEAGHILNDLTKYYNGSPVYYIFNFSGNGFVIVSADDQVRPVLGYSMEGTWSDDNFPPQFSSWMEGYAKQIDWSRTNNFTASENVKSQWEYYLNPSLNKAPSNPLPGSVDPLLISTWDQGNFYNLLCPADAAGPGGHVYAGCVATAMSQILFYYRWPYVGTGSHCYTPSGYPLQCADFGNTAYDWNSMLNNLSGQDSAVATLIWHCGVSVNMMYSPTGSGAYSDDAANAFKTYFKYNSNVTRLDKSSYPEDQWDSIMRDNLNHRRPLYYDGFGPQGGHAFNLDGYQNDNYFHFNWGWSGYYNGYFYLNNLNPGGDTFNNGQGAIVNLYPDTLLYTYPGICSSPTSITSLVGTFADASWPMPYQNNSSCSWLFQPSSISDSVTSITLSFDRFNTESGQDTLSIYKGTTTSDSLVGTFSGSNIPPAITVNGNKALVTFNTNGNVNGSGWYGEYKANTLNWCTGITTLKALTDTISDGSLYFNYKNREDCRWLILPENAGAVMFTFTKFNTEPVNDVVRFYDLGAQQIIAEYSGDYDSTSLPEPVTAPSGKMMVMFRTNTSITDKGWAGYYSTFPLGTQEIQSISDIRIFPNPAHDKVTLKMFSQEAQTLQLQISGIDGKIIVNESLRMESGNVEKSLNLSGLNAGVYILKITGDQSAVTKKLIIE